VDKAQDKREEFNALRDRVARRIAARHGYTLEDDDAVIYRPIADEVLDELGLNNAKLAERVVELANACEAALSNDFGWRQICKRALGRVYDAIPSEREAALTPPENDRG
jgi:hypothetical protein